MFVFWALEGVASNKHHIQHDTTRPNVWDLQNNLKMNSKHNFKTHSLVPLTIRTFNERHIQEQKCKPGGWQIVLRVEHIRCMSTSVRYEPFIATFISNCYSCSIHHSCLESTQWYMTRKKRLSSTLYTYCWRIWFCKGNQRSNDCCCSFNWALKPTICRSNRMEYKSLEATELSLKNILTLPS